MGDIASGKPKRPQGVGWLLWLAIPMFAGCGPGNGQGLDLSGRPLSEGGNQPLAATLESIQANVFNPSCIVCHSGASAPLGLRLDSGNSYAALVGVRSREVSSLLRVNPGAPEASYLVRKLEGTAAEGDQMPLGGPPVPQSTIDFIRQWIIDGALPASAGPGAAPPVVISMSPAPGSSLTQLPVEISIGFDRELDASTVNSATVELTRSGGDGQFGDVNDVFVTGSSVMLSTVNPRLALVDLGGAPLIDDVYQITARGSGPAVILDLTGRALDGEFSGEFPSGDGSEGGDFVAAFEVRGLQPTLASIQSNIFSPTCATTGCHTGPAGPVLPGGMDLSSAAASAASLIDVPSVEVPAVRRVAAGDADNSYLVQKLENTAASGVQMPYGGPYLDQVAIDAVRSWIQAGAPQ